MTTNALTVGAGEKERCDFGRLSVCWKVGGSRTGWRFSVAHHPVAPRALAAPLHNHHNEDELSYVVTRRLGALWGDEVVTADAGAWVRQAAKQWHTFWNAGKTPCEFTEVISPAGCEARGHWCSR